MAFCENCKTYTNNHRADSTGAFSCRNCGSPLIFAPSSGNTSGKGSKGGKGSKKNKKLMETKVVLQPSPDDPFMDMSENVAPAPKSNDTSKNSKTAKKSSGKSGKQSTAPPAIDDDFDDIPMPTIPQKPAKSQSPLILIAVGFVGLLLGLGIGVVLL